MISIKCIYTDDVSQDRSIDAHTEWNCVRERERAENNDS